jgi:hypothetical protein
MRIAKGLFAAMTVIALLPFAVLRAKAYSAYTVINGGQVMFGGIKKRWAEARAIDAKKDRWDRMNALDQQLVTSAFEAMMSEIPASLDNSAKAEMSKGIMKAARADFSTRGDNLMAHTSRVSAFGGALVSLYLECQILPGEQATRTITLINDWKRRTAR